MAWSSRVRRLHRIITCGDEPELWHLPCLAERTQAVFRLLVCDDCADFGYGYDVNLGPGDATDEPFLRQFWSCTLHTSREGDSRGRGYHFQAFFETLAQPIDTARVIELAH